MANGDRSASTVRKYLSAYPRATLDRLQRPVGLMGRLRRAIAPTRTAGTHGVSIYGGWVELVERDKDLAEPYQRYRTYSDILANTAIVAAGVRYFLDLVANAEWKFEPGEADTTGEYAERVERMLTHDPATSWARIVRRSAMYRFYGFSIQEWTAKRDDEGAFTMADIAPRAQRTIERWDVDASGAVLGVIQRRPQTQDEVYLPRSKIVYLVDDSLHDSPEGLGLFRHLVEPNRRLRRYEELEGFGFENDLRGTPMGRAPFAELDALVRNETITEDERDALLAPLFSFLKKHIKNPALGIALDSAVYQTTDDAQRPSNVRQWDLELMRGSAQSHGENAAAIQRLNNELAIILGVQQLLLGTQQTGTYELSRDKTHNFFLKVDSCLKELEWTVERDLIATLGRLNGWDDDLLPSAKTDAVRFTEIEAVTAGLRDVALAGLPPDDPAILDVRDLMGISHPPEDLIERELDASLAARENMLTDPPDGPSASGRPNEPPDEE